MMIKPKRYILAIDHGTSGVKAAIVSTHGELVDWDYEPTPMHFFPNGGAEQNPDDWWRALVLASQKVIRRQNALAGEIAALSISSTFSSTVAVDRNGHHLMNSLTWMDSRGARYVREVMQGFPSVNGYGLVKVLRWVSITGGGPALSGKDDIAHVLLIKYEHPEVYEQTYKFLGSKDYLNLRLTGEYAATPDSITLFWVTDIRNIQRVRYDDTLIARLKIDKDKLPSLRSSVDALGPLRPEVAEELGLGKNVRVFMGAPDHQCALIGSGAVTDFNGHLYIGTSSWIECIVPFKKTDVDHNIASLAAAIPGKYQCINEQDIAGGCLPFLLDNLIFYKNALQKNDPPEKPFALMDEIAASVLPGSDKVIFVPWLNGERSPVDNTTLRGALFNLSVRTNQNHLVRAVLEGVAYNTRWSMGYVEKFIGRKMDSLNIVGGGGNSDVWCQIFSDVLDREIRKVKNPQMTNARGAAFLASVGLGDITFEDIPTLIQYEKSFTPSPANRALYDVLYAEFLAIYKNNKSIYQRLNG